METRYSSQYTLLDAVTTDTEGDALHVNNVGSWNATVVVSGNTGAVTTIIEGSEDSAFTNPTVIDSTTKTAVNENYNVALSEIPYNYIRAITDTQSDSTVTVTARLLT